MTPATLSREFERLSESIGAIYDCVVDPSGWDRVLDDLCQVFECTTCVFYVADRVSGRQRFHKTAGIEPRWAERLPLHASDLDKLHGTIPDFHTRPLDEPFVCRRDVRDRTWFENPFFRQWAEPQGLVDFIDIIVMRQPDRIASCALGRHEAAGLIGDSDVELMRRLAPHLRRAVSISDLIDMKSLEAEALADTLDTLDVAVVLVGGDAEIIHANRTAADMLRRRAPAFASQGRLCAADPCVTERLHRTITSAARCEAEIGAAGIGMALSDLDGQRATAHVLPLANGHVRTRLAPSASAAVFIACDALPSVRSLDGIVEVFGLSAAERRVVERLLLGESVYEAAQALGIAQATVKTHLSRVLSKTGSRRQADLLTLIHRLAPQVGA